MKDEENYLDNPSYATSYLNEDDNMVGANPKMDMAQFNGNDPQDWLFKTRRFFLCYKTLEDQKL